MEVVDRVETQERIEKLTEEQKDDLFTKLVMGKDVIETVDTSRGKFNVKYPRAADILAISRLAAYRRNFKPLEAFDNEADMINHMASTLDIVVIEGPKWYNEAKTRNPNFSFLEVPSRKFIAELYGKAYSFREKVELCLDPPEGSDNKSVSPEKGNENTMDGGTFEGLSSKPGNTGT